jgi:two-component system response regulator NreC
VKILVVEDQTMFGELLADACIQAIPGAQVETAPDGAGAVAAARRIVPRLVILDLVLPDCDGLSLTKDFLAIAPSAKIVVLSSHLDEFTLHRAAHSRVHGIIHKNERPAAFLREAIDTVMSGKQYYSPIVQSLRASLRADPAAFNKILSDREQEVLRLIGEGCNDEAIAGRLGFTARTAKAHRVKLMAKLNMHSTPQLIRYALEKGFARITSRTPGA